MTNGIQNGQWWTFQCSLWKVVDGDTYDLWVDLGFSISQRTRVRLMGVDTAETYGVSHDSEEYARGKEQARWVAEWFSTHGHGGSERWPFVLETEKDTGKYGRYVAVISAKDDGSILNSDLAEAFPEVVDQ